MSVCEMPRNAQTAFFVLEYPELLFLRETLIDVLYYSTIYYSINN